MTNLTIFPKILLFFITLLFFYVPPSTARIYLDITSADLRKLPVAVPYFIDKREPEAITDKGQELAKLLGDALEFHGFITIVPLTGPCSARSAFFTTSLYHSEKFLL